MTDHEPLEDLVQTTADAGELNDIAYPLGYGVTFAAGGSRGVPTFVVHRIDRPVANGPSFDSAEAVRAYLDQLAKLPRWRLDLNDESIVFDGENLTVTDTATGETFLLRHRGLGVTGRATGGEQVGQYQGARHLSVNSEAAPTVGKWYKSDLA